MQRPAKGILIVVLSCLLTGIASHVIDGIFTEPTLDPGYNLVATIPQGALNLNVSELRHTPNYLAIRLKNGTYLINGNYDINWSGEYKAAGSTFVYLRQSSQQLESFAAAGPIQEPIDVMVLYQEPNPGIVYRYVIPSTDSPVNPFSSITVPTKFSYANSAGSQPRKAENISAYENESRNDQPRRFRRRKFSWKVVGLTECSKICGGGFQTTKYSCVREHNQQPVPEKRCHALDQPASLQLRCNVEPCTAKWKAGAWGGCSVSCGKGTRTRSLECVQGTNALSFKVPEDVCSEPKTLPSVEVCNMQICENHSNQHRHGWTIGTWSECSVTCGSGSRNRVVACSLHEKSCDFAKKPAAQEICDSGPCLARDLSATDENGHASEWLYTEWSEQCSAECGTGVQNRRVFCERKFANESCSDENRPEIVRDCSSDKICSGQWFVGPWNQCSPSCELGEQRREVVCVTTLRGSLRVVLDMNCPADKPDTRKSCTGPACPPNWFTSDWSQCTRICGRGIQKREVFCIDSNGPIPESQCMEHEKPTSRRVCNDFPCKAIKDFQDQENNRRVIQVQDDSEILNELELDPTCKDSIPNCSLVIRSRLCRYQFYRKSCCLSCAIVKHDIAS